MGNGEVVAFLTFALVGVRLFTAVALPISDCDETYNYWEPLHYLLFGNGLQTWEYSAEFALRSWLFVWLYATPAKLLQAALGVAAIRKDELFLLTKICIAMATVAGEMYFAGGMAKKFGPNARVLTLLIGICATGYAQAAAAFLPSTFAMVCFLWAGGGWLRMAAGPSQVGAAPLCITIFSVALAALAGWPFAALVGVPIGLWVLVRCGLLRPLGFLIVAAGGITGAIIAVDSIYYCRRTFATWNIVAYNVFGGEGRGPEIFGVEPASFFFKNLGLNFNVVFVVALAAPLLVLLQKGFRGDNGLIFMTPFFLWFGFWLRIPHKEERFMVPAYPFLTLAAVLGLMAIRGGPVVVSKKTDGDKKNTAKAGPGLFLRLRGLVFFALVLAFAVLSVSRTAALVHFYKGPELLAFDVSALPNMSVRGDGKLPLCVGREWYRFPSSFFVPTTNVKSGLASFGFFRNPTFTGALPKPFLAGPNATCTPNKDMNDLNQEIPGQYVGDETNGATNAKKAKSDMTAVEAHCRYVFDSDNRGVEDEAKGDAFLQSRPAAFEVVAEQHLLDAANTPSWCRLLYLPSVTEKCAKWHTLRLWRNKML